MNRNSDSNPVVIEIGKVIRDQVTDQALATKVQALLGIRMHLYMPQDSRTHYICSLIELIGELSRNIEILKLDIDILKIDLDFVKEKDESKIEDWIEPEQNGGN